MKYFVVGLLLSVSMSANALVGEDRSTYVSRMSTLANEVYEETNQELADVEASVLMSTRKQSEQFQDELNVIFELSGIVL